VPGDYLLSQIDERNCNLGVILNKMSIKISKS